EADEELRRLFPDDLTEGREKQALFLEQWLGGEPRYSERYGHPRLRMRHFPFVIDERAAGRWLRHMGEAFRAAGVPEREMQEVFAGLGPLARQMVNAGDDVPREPLADPFLT
ncbi:MAG: globin, partial [Dehalococcoidia bacterium]